MEVECSAKIQLVLLFYFNCTGVGISVHPVHNLSPTDESLLSLTHIEVISIIIVIAILLTGLKTNSNINKY